MEGGVGCDELFRRVISCYSSLMSLIPIYHGGCVVCSCDCLDPHLLF